ncbi:MAG: helix-turn-helix domain-containing protein [Thermoguttaceae bacterium]
MAEQPPRYLTTTEIATRLRVSPEKVLGWIRRAELRAVNVGNGHRPRYRISPEDFGGFLRRREVQAPPPIQRRRRRQPPEGGPLDPELGKKLAREGKAELVFGKYYRVWNGMILFY